jgi:proteasome lid subunit RPN8/RPN11
MAVLKIPLEIIQRMLDHVINCYPEEGCGILGGKGGVVREVFPVTNSLHSPTRFRMAPEEQLQAILTIENEGLEITAIYHSHPNGPEHPSQTDLDEFKYPGSDYLIWYIEKGKWKLRAFRIHPNRIQDIELIRT